ncbi:MAG: hypothetical protein KKA84_12440 [Bacteroidetes bacterium]|nr:hypothetical protein [Bacteroidota bacterium]
MKSLLTLALIFALTMSVFGQEKTKETKTTTNKESGETVTTESVIISESEDITPRTHMLIINPLKFLLFYNITYYNKVSDNLVVGGGIQTPTIKGLTGVGVNFEMRYYPTGKNMRGFYLAPNVAYNSIKSDEGKTSPFSMGALVGWQWFPSDQFAIGLGIGTDYYSGSSSSSSNHWDDDDDDFGSYNGWVPALRFDIGFAW